MKGQAAWFLFAWARGTWLASMVFMPCHGPVSTQLVCHETSTYEAVATASAAGRTARVCACIIKRAEEKRGNLGIDKPLNNERDSRTDSPAYNLTTDNVHTDGLLRHRASLRLYWPTAMFAQIGISIPEFRFNTFYVVQIF